MPEYSLIQEEDSLGIAGCYFATVYLPIPAVKIYWSQQEFMQGNKKQKQNTK